MTIIDTILQGDCIDHMRQLPDNSVDAVFADPPYFMQLHKELYRPDATAIQAVHDDWDKFTDFADYDAFTNAWLTEARRVLKDTGTLWVIGTYHNIFRVGCCLQNQGFWILNDIIWRKVNPMPNFKGTRFANAHETLIWCAKYPRAKYTFNYDSMRAFNDDLQMRSDWWIPVCNGPERLKDENGHKVHTTQKPEELLYRVILAATRPGDTILDPFFGTGTTGAVAKKLGRHYIGIERDPAYIRAAQSRIDAVTPADAADLIPYTRQENPKVPFGALLATGYLRPGCQLKDKSGRHRAFVRADGSVRVGTFVGSIHQAGAACTHKTSPSCNGWLFWYAKDPETQEWVPLDTLRRRLSPPQS